MNRLLVFGVFFLLIACSSNIEKDIVGEWGGTIAQQDLVFYSDGRVDMKGHSHGVYQGVYKIENSNELTCTFPRLSKPVKSTAKISGDNLTLIFPSGRKESYLKK